VIGDIADDKFLERVITADVRRYVNTCDMKFVLDRRVIFTESVNTNKACGTTNFVSIR
jgi:hypothetical protein